MKYYLFFVFLILFGGCSQRSEGMYSVVVASPDIGSFPNVKRHTYTTISSLDNRIPIYNKVKDIRDARVNNISLKGKQEYIENQLIQFSIDTEGREGYLYIVYFDNKGKATFLYPNPKLPLVKLFGKYVFPRDLGGMDIRATKDCTDCEKEKTTIYTIFSIDPILDINSIEETDIKLNTRQSKGLSFESNFDSNMDYRIDIGKIDFFVKGNDIIGKVAVSKSIPSSQNYFQKTTQKKIIEPHIYTAISKTNHLKKINNIATYVLFPKNLKEQNQNTKKYKRYAKVLELIQELSKSDNHTVSTLDEENYINKFIIMNEKLETKNKVTVESYNYQLSNKILNFFKEKVPKLFFDKEGPFFITTTESVFNKNKKLGFLYLDLSTFNDSAITQAVNSYKNRLVKKGDSDIDTLEKWHYNILSIFTNFNDNLHLFQVAVAGEN